jgi:hypothetical protein
VTGLDLTVTLYDDDKGWWIFSDGDESGKITILGDHITYDFSLTSSTSLASDSLLARIDIWHDGTLNVWISSLWGDFYVDKSELIVYGDDGEVAPVPEPATILLMGTGLLGLVAYSRKRYSKKS